MKSLLLDITVIALVVVGMCACGPTPGKQVKETASQEREEALKTQLANGGGPKALSCRVSSKGGLSIYGLQRFPVTLYVEQWERLLAPEFVDAVTHFMIDHKDELSRRA